MEGFGRSEVGVVNDERGTFPRTCCLEVEKLAADIPAHRDVLRVGIAAVSDGHACCGFGERNIEEHRRISVGGEFNAVQEHPFHHDECI